MMDGVKVKIRMLGGIGSGQGNTTRAFWKNRSNKKGKAYGQHRRGKRHG